MRRIQEIIRELGEQQREREREREREGKGSFGDV
jgi:hypothetical protein